MGTYNKKSGYTLLLVMVVITIASIALSSVYKYGEIARARYGGNTKANQAFWCADAGIEELKAMVNTGRRAFGKNGLPDPGTSFSRSLTRGSYTVDISQPVNRRYTITSTGVCMGQTNVITLVAILEGFSQAVLSSTGESDIYFTDQDDVLGPVYMNGQFWYQGSPRFYGEVQTTEDHITYGSRKTELVFPDGTVTDVFKDGVYLNAAELDFTGEDVSNENDTYLDDIANNADVSLTGDVVVELKDDGSLEYSVTTYATNYEDEVSSSAVREWVYGSYINWGGQEKTGWHREDVTHFETNSVPVVSSTVTNGVINLPETDAYTLYVDGPLALKGELDGELTLGCSDEVVILDEGVKYASAPDDSLREWSDEEKLSIDDYLAVVSQYDIKCDGEDAIKAHGAFMSMEGGMYPTERDVCHDSVLYTEKDGSTWSGKPKMYIYGSVSEKVMEASELNGGGFGLYWVFDPRLEGRGLQNFPERGYDFESWTSSPKR